MRCFGIALLAVLSTLLSWGTGGCGGSTNFCNDPNAVSLKLFVTDNQCSFGVNSSFRGCFLEGEEATIAGLVTNGDNINCSIEADTLNQVAQDLVCVFDIHSIVENEDYTCYAGIEDDGSVSGSIWCNPGAQDGVTDGCRIVYQ